MQRLRRKDQTDTVSIETARQAFLNFYAAEKPEVMGELETVIRLYPADEGSIDKASLRKVRDSRPRMANALSEWARKFLLTFRSEPADWVIDTAQATVCTWTTARAPEITKHIRKGALPWCHSIENHAQYPAAPPDLPSWARVEGPDVYWIRISIAPWNRPSGETEQQFKDRFYAECNRVFQEHVAQAKEWTERPTITEWRYIHGLAMWQAGQALSEIHSRLAEAGLNVGGQNPKDPDYNSPISKGIKRIARLIQLDVRQ